MSTKTKKKSKFTADYFLAKFKAIPGNKWITEELREGDKCCALGWCGVKAGAPAYLTENYRYTREALALEAILQKGFGIWVPRDIDGADTVMAVNDATCTPSLAYAQVKDLGKTPRTRILNALRKAQKVEAKART